VSVSCATHRPVSAETTDFPHWEELYQNRINGEKNVAHRQTQEQSNDYDKTIYNSISRLSEAKYEKCND
jgi:hypothetical protein